MRPGPASQPEWGAGACIIHTPTPTIVRNVTAPMPDPSMPRMGRGGAISKAATARCALDGPALRRSAYNPCVPFRTQMHLPCLRTTAKNGPQTKRDSDEQPGGQMDVSEKKDGWESRLGG